MTLHISGYKKYILGCTLNRKENTMLYTSSEALSSNYITINNCACEKLHVVDTGSYRPNGRIDYHIVYIAEGCCYITLNENKKEKIPAGSVIVYLPHQKQEYEFLKKDKSISYYVHFTGTICEQLMDELELNNKNIYYIGKSVTLEKKFDSLIEEFQLKPKYSKYRLQGLLLEVITLIAKKNSNIMNGGQITDKKFNEICKEMRKNFSKNIPIMYYANKCNLSESRFSHLFTNIIGTSPKQYMIMCKIDVAKELLINSDMSVYQISEDVGFSDQNYFSRAFKKHTGLSPSEYRSLN